MPENVKWELISFALKIAPVLLGLLLAFIASKVPSLNKALVRIRPLVSKAFNIVNQIYVEPRKANGTWDEAAKAQARELFWQKFLELATEEANYWLTYLISTYGEDKLKALVVNNELHDEMQIIKRVAPAAPTSIK